MLRSDLARYVRAAYATGNREGLLATTSDDFTWHQHFATKSNEQPTGRVLNSIDELLTEIAWRKEHWSDVKYANLKERATTDLLVQTFTITGTEDGTPFHADAVDLYPIRNNRITRKDTYWKYLK